MLCNPVHEWESIVHAADKSKNSVITYSPLCWSKPICCYRSCENTFQVLFQQFSDYSCQAPQRTEKHFKKNIKFHMTCTLQYMPNLFELCVRNKLKFWSVVSENHCPLLQISETLLQIYPYSVHNNSSEIHFWVNYSYNYGWCWQEGSSDTLHAIFNIIACHLLIFGYYYPL